MTIYILQVRTTNKEFGTSTWENTLAYKNEEDIKEFILEREEHNEKLNLKLKIEYRYQKLNLF